DGVGSQPKVPDELQDKAFDINEGTGTIPGVLDVPKDQSESENESWGESRDDDDSNDDDNYDDSNEDDSDDDGNNDASNDEGTEFDNNQNDDDKEEEYVRTPSRYESINDENKHVNKEEYDSIDEELYKDMNVKLKDVEHGKEGKTNVENTDAGHDDNQVIRHPHFLPILVTIIPETSTSTGTTIPLPIPPFTHLLHQSTPTTKATTSLLKILDFSSLCGFNQRVSILKKEHSQLKQVDHSAQLLEAIKSQVHAAVESHLGTRLRNTIQQVLKEDVKSGKEKYMEFIDKYVKANVIDQVRIQLP
nr:hypothetical protein [Tanacetum cinerariifolium]